YYEAGKGWRRIIDLPDRDSDPHHSYYGIDHFDTGSEKDPNQLRKTNYRQPTIWGSASIPPGKSEQCRCDAYHFCTGNNVSSYIILIYKPQFCPGHSKNILGSQ